MTLSSRTLHLFLGLLILSTSGLSQTSRIQLVHNSPYAEAARVDVYVDGTRLLDDFEFRTATAFSDLASGTHTLAVTDPNAQAATSPLFETTLTLAADTAYIVIAAGDPLMRDGQPDFGLFAYAGAREAGSLPGFVDALSFEGSPDMPPNVTAIRGLGPVLEESSFGEFSDGYLPMPAGLYDIDILAGENVILSVVGDARSDGGMALLTASSGFLEPPAPTDPSVAILSIYPDGVVRFMPQNTAKIQLVHASPYPSAAVADVYVDGILRLDDFAYRNATPFLEWPSGTLVETAPPIVVELAAQDAPEDSSPLLSDTLRLVFGAGHFGLIAGDPLRSDGQMPLGVYLSSNVPTQNRPGYVYSSSIGAMPDFSGPIALKLRSPHTWWADTVDFGVLDVSEGPYDPTSGELEFDYYYGSTPDADSLMVSTVVNVRAEEWKDLSTVNVFCGFRDPPSAEYAGASVLGVLSDGSTFPYRENVGFLRVVNLSPYEEANTLDVYLGARLLVDNLAYGEAGSLTSVPSGLTEATAPKQPVDVTKPDDPDNSSPLLSVPNRYFLFDHAYLSIVTGDPENRTGNRVLEQRFFDFMPPVPLPPAGRVDLLVFHGIPDAPNVSLTVAGVTNPLVSDLGYGAMTSYLRLPRQTVLHVWSADGQTHFGRFELDLPEEASPYGALLLGGLASGTSPLTALLVPLEGPALPIAVPTEPTAVLPDRFVLQGNFPNPFNPSTTIRFDLPEPAEVTVRFHDLTGREVLVVGPRRTPAGADSYLRVDSAGLPSGVYVYRLTALAATRTWTAEGKVVIVR